MSAPPAPPNQPPRGGYGGNYGEQPNGPEKPTNKLKYAIGAGALAVIVGVGVIVGISQSGGDRPGGSVSIGESNGGAHEVLDNEQCISMDQDKEVYGGAMEVDRTAVKLTDADILAGLRLKDYDDGDLYRPWIDPDSLSDAQKEQLVGSARKFIEFLRPRMPDEVDGDILNRANVAVFGEVSRAEQIDDGKIDSPDLGICLYNVNYR